MRLRTNLLFLAGAVAALAAEPPGVVIQGQASATVRNGAITINCKLMATPDEKGIRLTASGIRDGADRISRFLVDATSETYFGYDLIIGSGDAVSGYQVYFAEFTGRSMIPRKVSAPLTVKPGAVKYPAPQLVRPGDVIALDLLVSSDGLRKVTDYIEIVPTPEPPAAATTATPKDYSIDDGPVTFNGYPRITVWLDGTKVESVDFKRSAGATAWIAIPEQGRYVLSMVPSPGFARLGSVRDNVMEFSNGGRRFEVRFVSPIAGANKAWNLYVLHDAEYRSPTAQVTAGINRLDNLVSPR